MKAKRTPRQSETTFDSFLEEEGIREEVEAVAVKRVLAWQLAESLPKLRRQRPATKKVKGHAFRRAVRGR